MAGVLGPGDPVLCAGTVSQYCARKLDMRQEREMCLLSESDLYCVSTLIL